MSRLLFVCALALSSMALAGNHRHTGGEQNNNGNTYANSNNNGGGSNSNGVPPCMDDHGNQIGVDNNQVIQWENNTPNQFQGRAFVSGTIDQVFPDETGHVHFSLKIGPTADDHVEIIYNLSFGNMPTPQIGDQAAACGDYITANSSGSRPSPDGALIHWVHKSTEATHPSGFVYIGSQLYGEGNGSGN